MRDTPLHIRRKQFEILNSKPLYQKISGLFEMTELSIRIIKNRIRINSPQLSEMELNNEVFKVFYSEDFGVEEMEKIVSQRLQFFEDQQFRSSEM